MMPAGMATVPSSREAPPKTVEQKLRIVTDLKAAHYTLASYSKDRSPRVRAAVAIHGNTRRRIANRLARDDDPGVRDAAISNPIVSKRAAVHALILHRQQGIRPAPQPVQEMEITAFRDVRPKSSQCGRIVRSTGLPCKLKPSHQGNCRSVL